MDDTCPPLLSCYCYGGGVLTYPASPLLLTFLPQVCVEAGMLALRREGTSIKHEDFMEGISQVQLKKKSSLQYYA